MPAKRTVSPEHTTQRRSSRNRTKATSVYDEAKIQLEAKLLVAEKHQDEEILTSDEERLSDSEEEEEEEEVVPMVKLKKSPKKSSKKKEQQKQKTQSFKPKNTRKRIPKALLDISKQCPEDAILKQLITNPASIDFLVRNWMEKYSSDANSAIRQIFEFVFHSIGCFENVFEKQEDGVVEISLAEIGEEEWQVLITDVVDTMRFTPPKLLYLRPIPNPSCENRVNFARVFTMIATTASSTDTSATQSARSDEVVGQLCTLLAEISGVGQPDVRLAVTTAILSLGRGLIQYVKHLQKRMEDTKRQVSGANTGSSRYEALTSLLEKLQRDVDRARSSLENIILNGVFLHRYRDAAAQVRKVCIESLGVYIKELPDNFLENQWLKYLGWMLSDKDAHVRRSAAHAIGQLIPGNQENDKDKSGIVTAEFLVERTEALQPFVTKFTTRLIDLVLDVNGDVAEEGLRCLLALLRCGLLDHMEEDSMWERVNLCALDDVLSQQARSLALMFVLEQLEEFDEELDVSQQASNKKKDNKNVHSMACRRIDALASWVAHTLTDTSSDQHRQRGTAVKVQYHLIPHIVTSILSVPKHSYLFTNPMYLISCLQREESAKSIDHNTAHVSVDVVKSRVLVHFLALSAQSNDRADTKNEESYDANTVLQNLPGLLRQYAADTVSMAQLCTIPATLEDIWHLPGNTKLVAALMKEMSATFLRVGQSDVLKSCSDGLHTLCMHNTSLSLSLIIKQCIQHANDDDPLTRSRALSRIGALSQKVNVSAHVQDWNSFEESLMNSLLTQLDDDSRLDDEQEIGILHSGLLVLFAIMLWKVRDCILEEEERFKDDTQQDEDESDDEVTEKIEEIITLRDGLMKLIDKTFTFLLEKLEDDTNSNDKVHETFLVFLVGISSVIRQLLPLSMRDNARSPSLRKIALSDSDNLTLVKHMTTVLRSREDDLRAIAGNEFEADTASSLANDIVLPLVRPIVSDWSYANRKEAGMLFSHMEHSGSTIGTIVTEMSKQLKRDNPVRMLEAHMACLRSVYAEWVDSEPSEPFTGPSQHPTDAEMDAFDQAEVAHRRQFGRLLELATKLSSTLGVGRIRDVELQKAIKLFLLEGVRYSFSHDENEDLVLGGRLSFLKILVKYATWVMPSRGNQTSSKETRRELAGHIDIDEGKLRAHDNFEDEVIPEDLEALDEFKAVIGMVTSSKATKPKNVPVTPTSHASTIDGGDESMESSSVTDNGSEGSSSSVRSTLTGRYSRNRASIGSRSRLSMASSRTSISNLSPLQEENSKSSGSTSSQSPAGTNDDDEDPLGRESHSTYASVSTRGTSTSLKRYNKRKAKNSQQSHITQATYDGRAVGSMSTHVEEDESNSVSSREDESEGLFVSAVKSKRTKR